ncbi:MAG: hypothetical protein QF483_09675 [Gammaproteobacteria bacterium]|nr:hypothetical protein [Gammaproteobacteria bacterium]MDP7420141.1 hypothetical protein [Gammaproteobacteria bacterium]MDP7661532.1 hypothetical protein [Gammaproteobacteria bacterium]
MNDTCVTTSNKWLAFLLLFLLLILTPKKPSALGISHPGHE